ncbi:MAG TPA: reverse transcriptase domain-containing protein [Terriglobia bacterium]|nr:reverse transcriptase domain-containing protein [Terriglobia bacterium]
MAIEREGNPGGSRHLRWKDVYREAELYKAVVRVYTKPLFHWRKALSISTDGKTLYDLAGPGLRGLDAIHKSLQQERFQFRPAVALEYNFNGKHRKLYISPWEERIVDLLLYRTLTRKLHSWFSPNSYAYRDRIYGLDRCQSRIARLLRITAVPLFLVKRDIADYFPSVDHQLLIEKLSLLVEPGDFLFKLLLQRVRFPYQCEGEVIRANIGIPFGSAVACLLANIYLTALDREIEEIPSVDYFRYADDILVLSASRDQTLRGRECLDRGLAELRLHQKMSHQAEWVVTAVPLADPDFVPVKEFRHLGLLFRACGGVALSRDKSRKIQNLFRFAFRRGRRRVKKIAHPGDRMQAVVSIAAETAEKGLRNVAILDYYLRHVDDEAQLVRIDRWLAEEVLSEVYGGHKKGNFRRTSFGQLRSMGLPSLVHRRRLIRNGRIESPFFIWQKQKATRAFRGTVARPPHAQSMAPAFSLIPEAAAS